MRPLKTCLHRRGGSTGPARGAGRAPAWELRAKVGHSYASPAAAPHACRALPAPHRVVAQDAPRVRWSPCWSPCWSPAELEGEKVGWLIGEAAQAAPWPGVMAGKLCKPR